jgi:hypothetical protein
MVWSWSHTNEAYTNAYDNLHNQSAEFLQVCFAEWYANKKDGSFSHRKHDIALKRAKTLPLDILAEAIWERAREQALCDNGGFNAWVCPHGCHTVPFDKETVENE